MQLHRVHRVQSIMISNLQLTSKRAMSIRFKWIPHINYVNERFLCLLAICQLHNMGGANL